jgi:anti-anti-sigma factor
MEMSMEIVDTGKEKNAIIVAVKGRMDAVSAPELEDRLGDWMDKGETQIIIDLGGLDYISSAGLRIILATAKKLKDKGGQLLLACLTKMVKEVFEISGFSAIIPIYESVESALAEVE